MSDEAVIEAFDLSRRFKRRPAVEALQLRVMQGEVFGLLGSDGAGKTTTMQMLAGILDPSGGRATVLGLDSVQEAPALTARIGYMSQIFSLYGRLTVDENIEFFADLHRVPKAVKRERKSSLLGFARLNAHRDRQARHLSGGMQKKLALCCALIHQPKLLLLDEPTTGVDPVSRREFWNILYQALAQGSTIVVCTPYMDEAERCTRVALMHEGKMVACDTPAYLRAQLGGSMIEIAARPERAALAALQRAYANSQPYVYGDRIHLLLAEGGEASVAALRGFLDREKITVTTIRPVAPSLEDVFVTRLTAADAQPVPAMSAADRNTESEVVVETRDLTVKFGAFTAVDRVSLEVRRGEIFGFLGPNGSGKTTTIKVLCGLLAPTSGMAHIANLDVGRNASAVKARIGYMSQRFSLYEDMTVAENIAFFAGAYGLSEEKLAEREGWAVALAGLGGRENVLARDLSGGLKQRLALACAILYEPEVLFLDEPTAGVDPLSRRRFWELIYRLSDRGVTVFVTTHYMDEAEHCHTLALLYYGRVIALGSPQALREGMRAGEMLEMECDRPIEALTHFQGMQGVRASFFGDRLHLLVDDAQTASVWMKEHLEREGHVVRKIERVPLSIEDVFITFIEMEQARADAIATRVRDAA